MSLETDKKCFHVPNEQRTSCVFQAIEEKEEIPGMGEDSVLEMLSYSKFTDLETWLCMPSTLLPRSLEATRVTSPPLTHTGTADVERKSRCLDGEAVFLSTSAQSLSPVLVASSTPRSAHTPRGSSQGAVSVRKRRRVAASPGGLHWNSSGSLQRDYDTAETLPVPGPKRSSKSNTGHRAVPLGESQKAALKKSISVDDRLLQQQERERHNLLTRLERGKIKLRNLHSLGSTGRYETRKKSESRISRLTQKLSQKQNDVLIKDFRPFFLVAPPGTSQSLDSMTQQMQNLHLSHNKKSGAPASPSAAKRLYRNLSEKLKGSHSSFDEAYSFGRPDRLRKPSAMQSSEALFEAVEQQDLDAVQLLLYQYTSDELDLNTPNSEGLTPLDIAIMTNNVPVARLLLKAGGKESPHFVSLESRILHLSTLVQEAQRRVSELSAQSLSDGLDSSDREKQLKVWEWRYKLYKRMKTGIEHAKIPEAPANVRLSVTSSTSVTVTYQEPLSINSAVVTKYRVEWSCLKDFSLLAGEMILDNLQSQRCTISGLTTGRTYYVQVSAYNMKGWSPAQPSLPPSAAPSNWRDCEGREPKYRGHIEAMERLLQQVRATHQHYSAGDTSKLQNPSRKQSVSRSLKHLFHSSNKFVKTLKRGLYVAAVFYHKDSLLVTNEDQIPIVEIDDSYSSSFMQDFLWFAKLSCMWEDVRWLRQSMSVSMSSSSTLQARQKMLAAAGQLQNLLGTHNLGRVYYEPIKDRHGNVLLVTIREVESLYFFNGKWMQVSKLQSQRKSLSTPEEPTALDILLITIQDILAYQRRSQHRLSSGLYLGFLKLSSSVDQIKVLVPQRVPNMLCHYKIRDNWNVSRDEWDWLQRLSGPAHVESVDQTSDCPNPLFLHELQMAVKGLLKQINLPLHQAKHFRLYTQEVLELGHNVSFLLLLPASDDVCTAPGQTNPYTLHSGFLNLPLQMFELVHFCTYKEKFISLYCRLSSVLDLDALITQQAVREAISDTEIATAKQRQQHILDFIQQMDEMWRDMRWITEALQYARYKQPLGGVPITWLVDPAIEPTMQKNDSTSSNMDYLPTPSPSPEMRRRKGVNDSQPGSDEEGCSEVFLPTDSDYDSSDALSPRDLDLVYSSSQDISQQAVYALSGSAPDVLQVHDVKYSVYRKDSEAESCTRNMESLMLTGYSTKPANQVSCSKTPPNPPARRKMLAKAQTQQSNAGVPQRWLRVQSESLGTSLSEGIYTQQHDADLPLESTSTSSVGFFTDLLQGSVSSHATYSLEGLKGMRRESRQNVRRIYVEPCKQTSPGADPRGWTLDIGGCSATPTAFETSVAQDTDSDDQTNAQVSEILSSTL
ncbi:ankyrin repeat and fibronectin type-III domain-containing protein 1 isoform X2 [Brienomyrus brachyistius]|uniref:ankyrin repeat and fibronectin type-III domain-containing protein 1 isoform X2 n=1 Tax=Brienomyrus brachyistius TaxID=42636 RepID=UPI0020B35B84|nr:ankyrin repeat and fibronectin type-III domain-containing protein 1 isoform X2 [Brienomyrus brachyistius]